jgi:hypothetical protein
MSRILKRPMFRKGGEVMEGIMTGIKPRERFSTKGMSDSMRDDLKNIQNRVNLIDAFSGAGASPLGDPLTQFLLQTGQNLIGGESAGGTKLQEIVGATKKPLDRAIKAQQVKDLSRRKIAASLLSKMGGDDIAKIQRNAKKISELTGRPYNEVLGDAINKFLYKDELSSGARRDKAITTLANNFMKEKKYGRDLYSGTEAKAMAEAYVDAIGKKAYKGKIVPSQPRVPKKEEFTKVPTGNEKTPTAYKPKENTDIKYLDNKIYYDIDMGTWLLYDQNQNLLFPYNK